KPDAADLGLTARVVQLRRHGGLARSCRRIWSMDVRRGGLTSGSQTPSGWMIQWGRSQSLQPDVDLLMPLRSKKLREDSVLRNERGDGGRCRSRVERQARSPTRRG